MPVRKIIPDLFVAVFAFERSHIKSCKKVILLGKPSQNGIGQRVSIRRVYITESSAVRARLKRDGLKHPVHIDLHESRHQKVSVKRQTVCRCRDHDPCALTFRINYRYFRTGYCFIIKTVTVYIIPCSP